jgi:sugar phosphate isomerase/epimerase
MCGQRVADLARRVGVDSAISSSGTVNTMNEHETAARSAGSTRGWGAARLRMAALALLALGACASEPAASTETNLRVARPLGSVQCSASGVPVSALARELADRGVKVLGTACATDGRMYAAMCGAPDGRLGVLEIRAADAEAAAALGFKPLEQWRGAATVPCRE